MSHKRWYAVFNSTSNKWSAVGVPYDQGDYASDDLFIGPLKTRRAVDYATSLGWGVMRIPPKTIEEMAKKSEQEKDNKEVVSIVPYKLPNFNDLLIPSTNYNTLLQHMMD